jgi:prepilin-type processing-associated H-X9-DG protein
VVPRLGEGAERQCVTDVTNPGVSATSQSEIAVMYDVVGPPLSQGGKYFSFNHVPGGGNVLYMDGHVEFLKYPTKYPVSMTWAGIAELIDMMS